MQTFETPFYSFALELFDGSTIHLPLQEPEGLLFNGDAQQLASVFAKRFQKKVMQRGNYEELLSFAGSDIAWLQDSVKLSIEADEQQQGYPDFELEYPFFYTEVSTGFWALVPQLQTEVFVEKKEELLHQLIQAVLQALRRDNRLRILQYLVETLWYKEVRLQRSELSLKSYSLAELDRLQLESRERRLPKLASILDIKEQQLYGYKKELQEAQKSLQNDYQQSLLLVGPTGVGKTTLVWELARQLGLAVPGMKIWETTASALIKELTADTGWQDQLASLCRELEPATDLLFVRNLLALFEVGQYEGNAVSMGEYLRDFLDSGQLQLISECSEEELARIETRSPNYSQHFRIIRLQAPKQEAELERIVLQKVRALASRQKRSITPEAIEEALRLYRRYMPYSGFPGKPIRFLESLLLSRMKEKAVTINRSTVIRAFCEETGMPAFMVDPALPLQLSKVQAFFSAGLFGQERAVEKVVDVLATVKTSMLPTEKPIASMLFVGPTGVGKTELAKVLASFMFGNREQVLRFDMSEYSNAYAVTRLTGSSYFSEGILTAAVRRSPFAVLLFDELEKAHPSFYDLLLQILGEGRLSDSRGQLVNFCSTIVIMTSNIGAQQMQNQRIGWSREIDVEEVVQHFKSAVEQHFRPELFNRIDQVLPFRPLSRQSIQQVVQRELKQVLQREGIKHRKLDLQIEAEVYDYLGEKGYDPKYGARALQRSLQAELLLPLAQQLNQYVLDDRLEVKVALRKGRLQITVVRDELGIEYFLEELTRNEYADHASDLRRRVQALREGNFLTQLQADLRRLETQKRKYPQKFKENYQQLQEYSQYLSIEQELNQLQAEIEAYEEQLALVIMDLRSYDTQLHENIDAWNHRYFDFKLNLYVQLKPHATRAALIIHGKQAVWLWENYRAVLAVKEMNAKLRPIWKLPGQETSYSMNHFEESGLHPPMEGASLYGLAVLIEGAAPYLYFSGEEGVHCWITAGREAKAVLLEVECLELPNEHLDIEQLQLSDRPKLKKGNARRTYEAMHLEDKLYGIPRREVPRELQWSFLTNLLDERFNLALDEVLQ